MGYISGLKNLFNVGMDCKTKELVTKITNTISDKKGLHILALDISEVSSLTDVLIVAEGNVDRHVIALAKAVDKDLRERGEKPIYIEGLETGDWVVMDYFNIMVHIFMPGLREKYQLERLWSDGKLLELDLNQESSKLC